MSTSQNNVRKIKVNQNKNNHINKKVATGDVDNKSVSSPLLAGEVSLKKEIKVEIKLNEKEEKNIEQRIKSLQEKNIELEKQLNDLKAEYESSKLGDIENLKTINNELDKKSKDVKKVANKNKKLITRLKNIETEISEKYAKAMDIKRINLIKNIRTEKKVQKDIDVVEKGVENMQKMVDITKKEQKRYEELLNKIEDQNESNLRNELETINNQTEKINKEIEQLTSIKSKHISCKREIQNLKSKLNLINNDIEFESKKYDMMSTIVHHRDNKILGEGSEKTYDFITPQMLYSMEIRKRFKKKAAPKLPKVPKSTFEYIKTEINSINKSKNLRRIISKENIKQPMSLIDNEFIPEKSLFTPREAEFLKQVIPENYINRYNEKFDAIKTEKDEVEKKFEEFEQKNNDNLQVKFKIDLLKLRIKTNEKDKTNLMVAFNKNKIKIINLKKEINEYKKRLKEQNVVLYRMNKYNKIYSDAIKKTKNKKM